MRKLIASAVALTLAATLAASCSAASGSSGNTGGSHSSGNSNPGCIPDLPVTCSSTPPKAGGGQPIASADAAPMHEPQPDMQFGDCSIDLHPPGVGLTPGAGLVLATAHNYCRVEPWSQRLVMSVQSCTQAVCSDNDWTDEHGSIEIRTEVPPKIPDYVLLYSDAVCLSDRYYRVAFKVSGLDAVYENGVKRPGAPFATEDNPIAKYGPAERFSKSECSGK